MKLRSWLAALLVGLGSGVASGQVATGTPPFRSVGGGPFNSVNLANLNVHFAVPILNKTGRGTAFSYNLAYDSSLWTPVTVSGSTAWQPAPNWGWQGQTEVATGYIGFTTFTSKPISCGPEMGYASTTIYSGFAYRDKIGVSHGFNETGLLIWNGCQETGTSGNWTATDGSGYTMYASARESGASAYITTTDGRTIKPPLNTQTGAASFTDQNGNEINVNSSNQFFDTLSSTTPVLTVSGIGTPASPTKFQYTAPSGGTATYSLNYTQYTVKTNFGFRGIVEYGPLSIALASSLVLPDGTQYQFTYEKPSGSCTPLSGTYSANCVTGR